jgi:hypothetical protein
MADNEIEGSILGDAKEPAGQPAYNCSGPRRYGILGNVHKRLHSKDMKTQYCVYFTRLYTRGKLKGLTPRASLAFPTLDGAKRWVKNVESNDKLDYRLKDARITEIPRIEPYLYTLNKTTPSTWKGIFVARSRFSQGGQQRDVRPTRKFTEFTEDKHQARWFRGE